MSEISTEPQVEAMPASPNLVDSVLGSTETNEHPEGTGESNDFLQVNDTGNGAEGLLGANDGIVQKGIQRFIEQTLKNDYRIGELIRFNYVQMLLSRMVEPRRSGLIQQS